MKFNGWNVYHLKTKKALIEAKHKYLDEKIASSTPCEKCGRTDMQTIDHIIPLKVLAEMGAVIKKFYDEKDIRILCRPCNHMKSDRLDFSTPKTKELLIKYLKLI